VVYKGIIGDLEHRYGYDLTRDDPYRLIPQLSSDTLVVHDHRDMIIPYSDSQKVVDANDHIRLQTTEGLGHSQLLFDARVTRWVLDHLFKSIPPVPAGAIHSSRACPNHDLAASPKAGAVA
jgi:hypothetical protein